MDLTFIANLYMPMVLVLCLCVGYVLKHWVKDVDNKIIPTVLAVLGAVCACVAERSIAIDLIVGGMVTGLASTGLHQVFKQFIEQKGIDKNE